MSRETSAGATVPVTLVSGGIKTMNITKYFEMLIDWKQLPAYRIEPRIDSFIGFYLPGLLNHYFSDKIIGVIPEFPLRLGTIHPEHNEKNFAQRSYKVDFYALSDCGKNYFVEVKTNSSSRRDKQDKYLHLSTKVGMKNIVEGVIQISKVSSYKIKYNYLKAKLSDLGLIDDLDNFSGKSEKIEILYVQPKRLYSDEGKLVIDFAYISDWLSSEYPNNQFALEFSDTIKKWMAD